MRHADRPAEWLFEVELGGEWQACREGFGSPPGPHHEVASEAVQKPSSTASRRSEDHTPHACSHTAQKTDVRSFFVDVRWRLLANFT